MLRWRGVVTYATAGLLLALGLFLLVAPQALARSDDAVRDDDVTHDDADQVSPVTRGADLIGPLSGGHGRSSVRGWPHTVAAGSARSDRAAPTEV